MIQFAGRFIFVCSVMLSIHAVGAARQMESLGRGVIAIYQGAGKVYVGWRVLGTDSDETAFNVYRTSDGKTNKLNSTPIRDSSNYMDENTPADTPVSYFVRPVVDGHELEASKPAILPANPPVQPFLSIPLHTQAGYRTGDGAVGDLDGDGEYEVVIKQEMQPKDNSQDGTTGQTLFEAYDLDGSFLWRINLGKNMREGAHYNPFIVYDFDGDGISELACKTADGTIDGKGAILGKADADYRNVKGRILEGPEYLTIFDGRTGAKLVSTDYVPSRGKVQNWGDTTGNRVDRFLACVAYLDGQKPSLILCRGYYTRTVLTAWNWRNGQLAQVWTFDSDDGTGGNIAYRGQGNHNLSVGDVDGDGKDEIIYGACAIDDDGKGLYTTGLGHGDAMHLSDIDPDRPGLEVFAIHERPNHPYGANLRDAATGKVIWGIPSMDAVRGIAMDIDPRYRGYECWAAGEGTEGLYDCRGHKISDVKPRSCNMGIWWDADLLRELLNGTTIEKWDYTRSSQSVLLDARDYQARSVNGSKSTPCFYGDILGDWREEVLWPTRDNKALLIFTTTIPTQIRMKSLMLDPIYRLSAAWQNAGYNQPTQVSTYWDITNKKHR